MMRVAPGCGLINPVRGARQPDYVQIDPAQLRGVFTTPGWLRDTGITAWLLVGVGAFIVAAVWLLAQVQVIAVPVITAAIVAAVASPLVALLGRHRVPRGAGAALILVGLIAVGVGLFVVIAAGIASETSAISGHLGDAADEVASWLEKAGVDPSKAQDVKHSASASASGAFDALLDGLANGVSALSGVAFFLAMAALSLFFLLKDGPLIRAWAERHLGLGPTLAHTITQRVLEALRGYFLGVTIVACFNAVVVTAGAMILGVPLAGTIAIVTFVGAYIPYLGAWGAGAFAVLIALGGAGADAAAGMVVVQLLANGLLQQLVQPIAYGSALGIHPLAVLVVTIAGGALFGAIGLILAAPLLAAATRIAADVGEARAEEPGSSPTSGDAAPAPAT
jgi:predicted PurR-regulated permease PerM